jgi:hypothetical protein
MGMRDTILRLMSNTLLAWGIIWGGDGRRLRIRRVRLSKECGYLRGALADARHEGRACLRQLVRELHAGCTAKMLIAARRADDGTRASQLPQSILPVSR